MRSAILLLSVAIGIGSASVPANACNARGEFCTYPGWAANAFSSDDDRVPDYWREDSVTFGYLAPGYGYVAPDIDAPAYGNVPAFGYAPVYGYAPAYGYGRVYGSGPAYGYVAPGYGNIERRYRWREGR
jgi:hypothetical protein